jgi:DNA end-binding protein Ku
MGSPLGPNLPLTCEVQNLPKPWKCNAETSVGAESFWRHLQLWEASFMASRPTWEGHLRLSLVTCPVRLFKATSGGESVHFHLLHRQTGNRVRQQYKDPEDGVVERRDLVRGYEVEKDHYIVVEDEELKKLKLESTKTIDIEKFVSARSIDRLFWEQPYFLVPDGKTAAEPYAVIHEAMQGEGQVALGRLVMANRERVVAVEVRGKGMLLTTLRSHDEVRAEDDFFDDIPDVEISPKMVEIAKQIISQAEGKFDADDFRDRYQEAVRELIESKAEGEKVVHRPAPAPKESNVIDLMEALRRSLRAPPSAQDREVQTATRKKARTQPKLAKPKPGERGKAAKDAPQAPSPRARRSGGKDGQGGSRRRA